MSASSIALRWSTRGLARTSTSAGRSRVDGMLDALAAELMPETGRNRVVTSTGAPIGR